MGLLLVSVATVLIVSALCSLTEAALYAVRMPFVRTLADQGSKVGQILLTFKQNMERPISAILIVNTVANTAGAAIAGSQARIVLGEGAMLWFSALITGSVLLFSEIVPKIIGVVYSDRISVLAAIPLRWAIRLMWPLIWFVERMSRWLRPDGPVLAAPESEVAQLAQMSAEEGSILPIEAVLVKNALRLNETRAGDIMTPRSVVFKLAAHLKLREVLDEIVECPHSRIPVYSADDPDTWIGVVLQRDVLAALARDQFEQPLQNLCQPIYFVADSTPGHILLRAFIRKRTHLFGVVNVYGVVVGVVTLEDVIESLIGEEIVDEADVAVDMQELARMRGREVEHLPQTAPGQSHSQTHVSELEDEARSPKRKPTSDQPDSDGRAGQAPDTASDA